MAAGEKEIEAEERNLSAWAESFSGRKETDLAALKAAADRTTANAARTDALLSAQDDSMLLRDTSRMSGPVLAVFLVRQKVAMDRILHRCWVADQVMAAATATAEAESAAAASAEIVATAAAAAAFFAAASAVDVAATAEASCAEEDVTDVFGHADSDEALPPRDEGGNGGDSDTEEITQLI